MNSIVGESLPMVRLRKLISRFAVLPMPVLIDGETGSGKELVARAIHASSNRASGRFVAINAATLSAGTMGSELFGHVRGAFTSADRAHRGLFDQANGGTVFIDEVADLTLDAQAQLLRVLEDGEVRPLGAEVTRHVDVRIVAGSHRNLGELVAAKLFRQDLLHRLRVLTITVAPLRDRRDDIPLLVTHTLRRHEHDLGSRDLTLDAIECLRAYDWPGNVRQLDAVLVRAAARHDAREIDRAAIQTALAEERCAFASADSMPLASMPSRLRRAAPRRVGWQALDADTVDRIREALRASHGKVATAARSLGLPRSSLRDLIKQLGITNPRD